MRAVLVLALLAVLTEGCGGGGGSTVASGLPSSAGAPPPTPPPVGHPTISAVTPNNGGVGALVSIAGTNFIIGGIESVTAVQFTGALVSATFTIMSDVLLSVTVPSGATNGKISVTVPNKTVAKSPLNFTAEPVVTAITPNIARAGITTMTITGKNFCGASAVTFNAITVTPTSSSTCTGADLTAVTAVLASTLTGPVVLVSVLTPSGSGTALEATSQTSAKRVSLLTSYASGFGGLLSIAPRDLKVLDNALYVSDPERFRLFSVNIATGAFLASISTAGSGAGLRPIHLAVFTVGTLVSVYASTDSLTSVVLAAAGGSTNLASLSGALTFQMAVGRAVAAQRLASQIVWFSDVREGQNALFSVRAVDGALLGSLGIGGALGSILAIGVYETASLTSVWFSTTLGSIGLIESPLVNAVLRSVATPFAITAGEAPAGLAFDTLLGSVYVMAGRQIGILTSTGASAGLFSLTSVASFGGGTPLVSSLAFDASGNLWYADAGQGLIVRCEGSCNTKKNLTSFALATVGGTRPRVVAVDGLGSVWFDEPNALERLMP